LVAVRVGAEAELVAEVAAAARAARSASSMPTAKSGRLTDTGMTRDSAVACREEARRTRRRQKARVYMIKCITPVSIQRLTVSDLITRITLTRMPRSGAEEERKERGAKKRGAAAKEVAYTPGRRMMHRPALADTNARVPRAAPI